MTVNLKFKDRKHKRRKVLAVVDLYKSISDSCTGQGCLLDISVGGASIESTVLFFKEQRVLMNIPLSGNSRYSIGGIVLRIQEMPLHTFVYGIKFEKLTFRERLDLLRITPILRKNGSVHKPSL